MRDTYKMHVYTQPTLLGDLYIGYLELYPSLTVTGNTAEEANAKLLKAVTALLCPTKPHPNENRND